MELENRLRIQSIEEFLRENLDVKFILPKSKEYSIIDNEDEERITHEVTTGEKVAKFLRILERKPPGSYAKFLRVLEEKEDTFIKDKLDRVVIDQAVIERRKKSVETRIKEYLNENYKEQDKKKVVVATLIGNLKYDFTKHGEAYFPTEEHIIEIVQSHFETVQSGKYSKKKKDLVFKNLTRLCKDEDTDEDCSEESVSGYGDTYEARSREAVATEKQSDSFSPVKPKSLNRKRLDEMTTEELCNLLTPKLYQHSIVSDAVTEIFTDENIAGKAFKYLNSNDIKELFPSFKFGERKLILVLRDELIEEEGSSSHDSGQEANPIVDTSISSSLLKVVESKSHFRETFRKFGIVEKITDTYRKGATLNTSNTRISNLIEPLHRFLIPNENTPSTPDWIAEEAVVFAAACMNERTNGTIHFGISGKRTATYDEGEIVGIHVDKSICQKHLDKNISRMFFDDQLEIAVRCIRPVQFVDVFDSDDRSQTLTVVEVDVVPENDLIRDEAFYVQMKEKRKSSGTNKIQLYRFESCTSNPLPLKEEEIRNYMNAKNHLSKERKNREHRPVKIEIKEDLRAKFLNLFTGGEEVLSHEIYPVLFLNAIDSSMTQEFIDENFKFLVNIDANAIFDFDPSSDKNGMFNYIENTQEQVVKAFTAENFDRNGPENRDKKERFSSMLDDLRTSSIKPWIFCNGYEAMDKEPLQTLEWKQNRSEGFKEALRFFHDEIPNGRAFVLFLLFSKNYEIMLEAADEVLVKFKDQWMVIAPNEDIAHCWVDELIRRKMTDKATLTQRCVVGLPWQHVNKMISDTVMPLESTRCEIVTSNGTYCLLREKVKNELFDLEVLSRKECGVVPDIISDANKTEKHRKEVEECFFKGGEVTWWNLWFEQDHVLRRSKHNVLMKSVENALCGVGMEEDNKVGVVNLFHQPGSGGTTCAKQILWDLKANYRCCIVKQLSEDTCEQITTLRNYEDPETPKPPLILIDNGDEEHIMNLNIRLEDMASKASRRNHFQVFCVLLLCTRRTNLPTQISNRSVSLKHELDPQELEWCNRKFQVLEKDFDVGSDTCHPRLLISFNILKENFNKDYIKKVTKEFVDGVSSKDEECLLKYLSLLNSYDAGFNSVPLSSFDPLMQKNFKLEDRRPQKERKEQHEQQQRKQCWEKEISSSLQILLNRTSRAGSGSQLTAMSIINSLFAREILLYLQDKLKHSTSEIMLEFLDSVLFKITNQSQHQLLNIVKNIMKKREEHDSGTKDKFSRIITDILEKEDADKAAQILIKGFEMSNDPMISQQIARIYIHSKNWDKAFFYAVKATQMKPQSSYLWDTLAQVYKSQLLEKYSDCEKSGDMLSDEDMKEICRIGFDGIRIFCKEQEVSSVEKKAHPNDAGYFGELNIVICMLDLLQLCPSLSKDALHKFLVERNFVPNELKFLDTDTQLKLKKLCISTELTMKTLEDKKTQVKEDAISDVFQSKPPFKDSLKELSDIKEKLDQYFGEDTDQIPPTVKLEDRPLFIRRRVRRLGGRSLPSILDISRNEGGSEKLQRMFQLLQENAESKYCDIYDIVTMISVALVLNIKNNETVHYDNFITWSRKAYDLVLSTGERSSLETYLYFVMFNWPTGNHGNKNICPTGRVVDAIKKWQIAFQNKHPRQDGKSVQKKETTYFFLGNGVEMKGIVYYEDLHSEHRGRYYIGDPFWRMSLVLSMLKRLTGTLVNEGLDIDIQVETAGGNKTTITIPTSMPIGRRALWQKKVYFVIGFGWGGPKAYDVTQEDPRKQTVENLKPSSPVEKRESSSAVKSRSQNSPREEHGRRSKDAWGVKGKPGADQQRTWNDK